LQAVDGNLFRFIPSATLAPGIPSGYFLVIKILCQFGALSGSQGTPEIIITPNIEKQAVNFGSTTPTPLKVVLLLRMVPIASQVW
jgi:hypothetical protein